MIQDEATLTELRSEWATVVVARNMVARNLAASSFGIGSIGPSHIFRNFAYSLCLLFAFSVLEHVLLQLRDEGAFSSKTTQLGDLMHASKDALTW